ncbi:hypothetical protein GCM10011492_18220 [Flexivirga endophytica]|uniref:HNH nuclease domain-containing protein n=2 Tax=Flexivirga endophytica TaxID=1849103 RepID=A0A916T4B4_9MICO|nr:hypothetical protein GCM10011492_18220 [Flexivirga endophytica]GHB62102.1 hypothetical protein GCM10008112_33910 [Flexivirga endophytica]
MRCRVVQHIEHRYHSGMSQQRLLVAGDPIIGASVDELLATAHALVRAATGKARTGTVGVSRDALIEQVVTCRQVQNSVWAAQSVRLAQVAATEEVVSPGEKPREVRHAIGTYTDEWLPQEIGARLGWSDRQTTDRLSEAVDAIRCTPAMFELTASGSLDARKINIVADTLSGVSSKAARAVEDELLAAIEDARADNAADDETGEPVPFTSTKLVRRTRRLLADLWPAEAEHAAAKRRVNAKGARAFPHHEPALSVFRALLPTGDAMRIMAGINELARQLHKDTTTGKSLDECRVDAFVDLMLGNVAVSTTCVVQAPVLPGTTSAAGNGSPAGTAVVPRTFEADSTGAEWSASTPAATGLEQLIRQSVAAGLDTLTRLDTPTTTVGVRTPCDADSLVAEKFVRSGEHPTASGRIRPRLRIGFGSNGSACSQRFDQIDRRRPDGRKQLHQAVASGPPDTHHVTDAVVEGLGVIPASVLTGLYRALGTKLTRALVDMRTGATIETADVTYRPGARLRHLVVTRDQQCRFPTCTRPARLDDVDHVIRWPDGPTAAWNLQCLCRHHHRAKHEGGWAVSMTHDGVCTWTSPSGRRYLTRPGD